MRRDLALLRIALAVAAIATALLLLALAHHGAVLRSLAAESKLLDLERQGRVDNRLADWAEANDAVRWGRKGGSHRCRPGIGRDNSAERRPSRRAGWSYRQ